MLLIVLTCADEDSHGDLGVQKETATCINADVVKSPIELQMLNNLLVKKRTCTVSSSVCTILRQTHVLFCKTKLQSLHTGAHSVVDTVFPCSMKESVCMIYIPSGHQTQSSDTQLMLFLQQQHAGRAEGAVHLVWQM